MLWILFACLSAPSPLSVPLKSPQPEVSLPTPSVLWTALDEDEAIGLREAEAWYFRSSAEPYGVFVRGVDGAAGAVQPIGGLPIIGQPSYWDPIPGGFLTKWDVPARIAEVDGQLSVDWQASAGRWWDTHEVVGDRVFTARYRPDSAVVALSLVDGAEVWRSPLPQESQGVILWGDADTLYVTWTEYDPEAPTPRVLIPARVRALERATGRVLWTLDFAEYPGVIGATEGAVVVAFDADLHFIRGVDGARVVVPTGQPPNIYPRLWMADGTAYVALNEAVTAYGLDGTLRWRQAVPLDGGPALAQVDDLLLVATRHRTLVALELASGTVRWEVGLGVSPRDILVSAAAVLARSGTHSVGLPRPILVSPERAVLSGQVRAECATPGPVWVGAQAVPLDAEGRYTATLEAAAGIVTVQATVDGPFLSEEEKRLPLPGDRRVVTVQLDGRGAYTVPDLVIRACGE